MNRYHILPVIFGLRRLSLLLLRLDQKFLFFILILPSKMHGRTLKQKYKFKNKIQRQDTCNIHSKWNQKERPPSTPQNTIFTGVLKSYNNKIYSNPHIKKEHKFDNCFFLSLNIVLQLNSSNGGFLYYLHLSNLICGGFSTMICSIMRLLQQISPVIGVFPASVEFLSRCF